MNAKSKESPAVLAGHSGFPWHWSFCLRPETDMNWREKSRSFISYHIYIYTYIYVCVCYIYYHIFGIIRISIKINQWISPKIRRAVASHLRFSPSTAALGAHPQRGWVVMFNSVGFGRRSMAHSFETKPCMFFWSRNGNIIHHDIPYIQ